MANKGNPFRIPDSIDETKPSIARVYDYALGGSHNFAVDRQLAERVFAIVPGYRDFARANRAFLRRVVLWMQEQGVTQFIDLGSGIPTVGNVHEIAPEAKIVYVDRDVVAATHSDLILENHPNAIALKADIADVDSILGARAVTDLLDLDAPVGVLTVAVLHFMDDAADPAGVLREYHDRLAPGSMLGLSHASIDALKPDAAAAAVSEFSAGSVQVTPRDPATIAGLLGPWGPVEPGVVKLEDWHPDTFRGPVPSHGYAVAAHSTR